MPSSTDRLSDSDYERLLTFRTSLRRFLQWSEEQAREAGLTPAQHQLLLAVRGSDDPYGPTVGTVADALLLRHHSTVGLIDRAVDAGLIERRADPNDHRLVRLSLTRRGERRLASLSRSHLDELARLDPDLGPLLSGAAASRRVHQTAGERTR